MVTWNYIACNLLVLDRNTWNQVTLCKSFILRIDSRSYNCLQIIIIKKE